MTSDPKVDILNEAVEILNDRGDDYGPVTEHHRATAVAVNAILGTHLTPRDVAVFFIVDKLVRARTSPCKRDHYVDIANYAAIAWEHATEM